MHVFNNGKFIAAGTRGNIYYYTGSSFVKQNNYTGGTVVTREFNDIYFHDDRVGYVVGDSGRAYKCVLTKNIGESGSVALSNDGIVWNDLCDQQISIGHTPANIDFNAIAFATRTQGFLAGSNAVTNNHLHALVLLDESMMYSTRFWYDKLGRMVISQNTKQFPSKYSYTLYDALGRIKEVGEKTENTSLKHKSIFGTDINGLFNTKAIDDTKLNDWIADGSGARKEVTRTHYDTAVVSLPMTQENLRKRVSTVTYEDVYDGVDSTYEHATHYTYDIHGNVKTLLQDNRRLYDTAVVYSSAIVSQRFKRVDYDYDLISGKVNKVMYQRDSVDQFIHKYSYDADNRITKVETSSDNILWQTDAKYFYYAHGPLARVEIGDNQVQGQDFAYTIQGWVKGVNSNNLNANNDIGQDGKTGTINGNFARDAYSYSLNYFNGDYKAISNPSTADNFISDVTAAAYLNTDAPGLYNGNISSIVTSIRDINPLSGSFGQPLPQLSAFKYDQLNRVVQMKAYRDINLTANTWGNGSTYDGSYETHLSYDANGNILSMQRNGVAGVNLNMDDMTYTYENEANGYTRNTNKLRHVNDNPSYTGNYANDLDDHGAFSLGNENYAFDEIGNQIQDKSEGIAFQEWNLYGRVKSITRYNGSLKPDLEFNYNALGQRISKVVKPRDVSGQRPPTEWITTYYVKDFAGNTMAVYEQSYDTTASFKIKERYIYGSNRLGVDKTEIEMIGAPPIGDIFSRTLGNKNYDLMNWRSDVLTTITDRKIAIEDTLNPGTIAYYEPEIITTNETYLFGMPQPLRNAGLTNTRHLYQSQEAVNEINGKPGTHYTTDHWELNTLTGRRENIDQVVKPWESGYATFANNPTWYSDPLGLDVINAHKAGKEKAESKMNTAKEKLEGLTKGDEGYKDAKKAFKQAERAFNNINEKFQRVESKINEIKKNDIDLFNAADKLTDAGGTKVDIYVYDTPEDIMQVGVKEGMVKYGDTDAQSGTQVSSYDGSTPDYTAVMSKKHGDNTITIRISDVAKTIHLAHEFGHAIYQSKNMKQYMEWLQSNPKEQNKGGHGKGDPSGKAAHEAEKKFR